MPFDYAQFLGGKPISVQDDKDLVKDYTDARWADFGRAVHANMMSERWLTATTTALVGSHQATQPIHHIARCLRAYVFTGTITR